MVIAESKDERYSTQNYSIFLHRKSFESSDTPKKTFKEKYKPRFRLVMYIFQFNRVYILLKDVKVRKRENKFIIQGTPSFFPKVTNNKISGSES